MPIKVIVSDIEGTTSSISFVKDNLFPYAVEHVDEYLNEKWADPDVQEAVKELREQYAIDVTNKVEGAVAISDAEGKDQAEQISEIVANVKWQITNDRKTTSLKKLQGLIWAKGYGDGTIKGHVYPDVPKAFERWTLDNVKIYIYSSGSEAAQKLLFGNSEHGDLTSKISGYFDTKIGAKQEKESYEKIVQQIGCDALDILFLTDIVNEANAAKESGIHVAILDRPGNGPLTDEEKGKYQVLTSFDDINLEFVSGKRKLEEILTDETNVVKIAKLDADEAVVSNITDSETVPETNGIETTDKTNSNDTKTETHVSNGNGTEITMNIDDKTEPHDIPMKNECDLSNKIVNIDVDVDSKPLIVDEVMKESEGNVLPTEVVNEKSTETETTEDVEMKDASIDTPTQKEVSDTPTQKEVSDTPTQKDVSINTPTQKDVPIDTPTQKDVSIDTPTQKDVPIDTPTQKVVPIDTPAQKDVPIETPAQKDVPIDTPTQKDVLIDTPTQDLPIDTPTQNDVPIETPTQKDVPVETPTQNDVPIDTPTQNDAIDTPKQKDVPIETPTQKDIPIETNNIPKSDVEDESSKVVNAADAGSDNLKEQIKVNPEITAAAPTSKAEPSEKVESEQPVENKTEVSDSKQNGDHVNIDVGNGSDEGTKVETDVDMENVEKKHSEDQVATVPNENGAKDKETDLMINNKENIPVDVVNEKENIIEIPIHIDGDTQSTQKPTIISAAATNGNGVVSNKEDIDTDANTNSNKEKMSRIELIIEEKDNDNGQLTQTTTHIVKEITIVKKNVCESTVDTADKSPENV